jgi:hypothetical protein
VAVNWGRNTEVRKRDVKREGVFDALACSKGWVSIFLCCGREKTKKLHFGKHPGYGGRFDGMRAASKIPKP